MSVISIALKHMLAAGMPHGEIIAAVAEMESNAPKPRTVGAIRQERYRRNKASQVTESDARDGSVTTSREPTHVEDNLLPKKISGQEERKQEISPEAAKAAPVAFELPCVSGDPFPVYDADIAEWAASFPAVDIRQQLAAARSWLIANPTRRKTRKGMRKFIVSWLDRRQNAGGQPQARAGPAPQPRQAFNDILDSLQGKTPHDAHPGPTIDGSIDGANRGGAANLVQLYAVPSRRGG